MALPVNDVMFSPFQAMQLLALGPCLFLVVFLSLTVRPLRGVVVPCLYFLALAASFMLPLLPLVVAGFTTITLGGLLFLESLTPALSFLLIVQLIRGTPPPFAYWLVLAIPVLGGSSFIYGALYLDEVCLWSHACLPTTFLKTLYRLFSSGLMFLLLTLYYSRQSGQSPRAESHGRHQYWLIITMILFNLLLLLVDLATITERLSPDDGSHIATVLRIGFIYLVLTSLFRVFDAQIKVDNKRIPTFTQMRERIRPGDEWMVAKLTRAMQQDCLYRDIEGGREALAATLGIPEHQLSRVINAHFGKSVSEFINQFRIDEAKARLCAEKTPVTTIAYEVGFGSIATFNRVFKEVTGQSPSAWRQSTREENDLALASE